MIPTWNSMMGNKDIFILMNYAKKQMLWILLESPQWGDYNKQPQHMFLGVKKKKKQTSYYLSYCFMMGFFIAPFFSKGKSFGRYTVFRTIVFRIWNEDIDLRLIHRLVFIVTVR